MPRNIPHFISLFIMHSNAKCKMFRITDLRCACVHVHFSNNRMVLQFSSSGGVTVSGTLGDTKFLLRCRSVEQQRRSVERLRSARDMLETVFVCLRK